jgi:hypothetical protein
LGGLHLFPLRHTVSVAIVQRRQFREGLHPRSCWGRRGSQVISGSRKSAGHYILAAIMLHDCRESMENRLESERVARIEDEQCQDECCRH